MSFAAWVQWFEGGHQASVPLAALENAFGASVARREQARWYLRHHGRDCCQLHLKTGPTDGVIAVTLSRPCNDPALWDGVFAILSAGNGVCYWPGSAPFVTSLGAAGHLPEDMLGSLGKPIVVADGGAISRAVDRV